MESNIKKKKNKAIPPVCKIYFVSYLHIRSRVCRRIRLEGTFFFLSLTRHHITATAPVCSHPLPTTSFPAVPPPVTQSSCDLCARSCYFYYNVVAFTKVLKYVLPDECWYFRLRTSQERPLRERLRHRQSANDHLESPDSHAIQINHLASPHYPNRLIP